MTFRSRVKSVLAGWGYEVRRIPKVPPRISLGRDPFLDMQKLATAKRPLIFDVGANVGQSVESFRAHFTEPTIHAFEPGAEAFGERKRRCANLPSVHPNNIALGAAPGVMP